MKKFGNSKLTKVTAGMECVVKRGDCASLSLKQYSFQYSGGVPLLPGRFGGSCDVKMRRECEVVRRKVVFIAANQTRQKERTKETFRDKLFLNKKLFLNINYYT